MESSSILKPPNKTSLENSIQSVFKSLHKFLADGKGGKYHCIGNLCKKPSKWKHEDQQQHGVGKNSHGLVMTALRRMSHQLLPKCDQIYHLINPAEKSP